MQWAYLGISLFIFGLAVLFYYNPLPEANDDELDELADRRSAVYRATVGSMLESKKALVETLDRSSQLSVFYYGTLGGTVFALGRFMAAFLIYLLKPRWILLFLYTGFIICCALLMALGGKASAGIAMRIYFFEAGIFSIIYAMCMRGNAV